MCSNRIAFKDMDIFIRYNDIIQH